MNKQIYNLKANDLNKLNDIIINTVGKLITYADEYEIDRDNFIDYVVTIINTMQATCTFKNYKVKAKNKPKKMKAYCIDSEYSEGVEIIFAETANKAKYIALKTDTFCEDEYVHLHARRYPKIDKFYKKGKTIVDWVEDDDIRVELVKEYGHYCLEPMSECCEVCPAKEYCSMCEDEFIGDEE